MKKEIIVVALGGNAIITSKEEVTYKNLLKNIKKSCKNIIPILKNNQMVITFGNGPEVGYLAKQNEEAKVVSPMPLDVLGAESQGLIGYLLEEQLLNELRNRKIGKPVVNILTQVLVNEKDKSFKNPSKPIGSFYTLKEAGILVHKGYNVIEDSGRGYRRVVPSPEPIKIIEFETIKKLVKDTIVIACGGGGIPVVKKGKKLIGVEAVIDKDKASSCLAKSINAKTLLILTGVDYVYLNYNKKKQKVLKKLNVKEAEKYLNGGQFGKGSMAPKIEAAIDFLKYGGKKVIITSTSKAQKALNGKAGTLITK